VNTKKAILVTVPLVVVVATILLLLSCGVLASNRTGRSIPWQDDPNPPVNQQVIVFQEGVSPDPSYDGTTDTILASDYYTVNVGGMDYVETFFEATAEVRRSIVRWELTGIPPGADVTGASVELYRHDGYGENDMAVALYRLTSDWVEGTGVTWWPGSGYVVDGATWDEAAPGTPWGSPGGDYDPTIVGQTTIPAGTGNRWFQWDATSTVEAWVEGGQPNYGVLLRPLTGAYSYHYYYSREGETPNLRPRLVVTYTVGGPATPTPSPGTPSPTNTPSTPRPTNTAGPPPTPSSWIYLPIIPKSWEGPTPEPTATSTPTPTGTSGPSPTPTDTVPPGALDVTLTVEEKAGQARADEPVTSGVPIPLSVNLTNLGNLRLLDSGGQPVPAQFTPLAHWGAAPDDTGQPVRWLLVDLQADVPANGTSTYRLVDSGGALPSYPTLNVADGVDAVTVDTGVAQFSISKTDGGLSGPDMSTALAGRATEVDGTTYNTTGPVTVTIVLEGAMRASVQVEGSYRDGGGAALVDYTSRYWFYAGLPTVRLFHTVENNNLCPLGAYDQPECYDIGSGGSVTVADLSLVLPADLTAPLSYEVGGEGGSASGSLSDELLCYQDSSGTDSWDLFPTFIDWGGHPLDTRPRMQAYVSFRGYETTLGATTVDSGNQAEGWLAIGGSDATWTVAVRDFWQNFPKALRASTDGTIEIGLFPDEFGPIDYGFNLRAGEHKTHEVLLGYDASPVGVGTLFAQAPAQWYVDSGALGLTALQNDADWPDHENYVDYQLTTSPEYEDWMDWFPNLFAAIEGTDFYGIFDYGDWPIDYEGYHVAPLNPKYDWDYGIWQQWIRGGDARWFGLAEAAGRHIADIDVMHNLHSPRHWYDGITFGHSYHDEDGFLNPHRNYGGNHPDVSFGMAGMLTTYYLTGYEKAYQSAMEFADCIEYRLHNDGNLCYFFPPGECSGEGYALMEGLYNAGGRPAANSLYVAVEAYRATADSRYLDVADALVDWADPTAQPYMGCPTIPGDERMMRPWMLNMYLRALANYLEMRGEFGLPDTYDGESDFLAYADWLRTCPWIDLSPIDTGPRGAYPYEWWLDGRSANDEPDVNNWTLLGADAQAYAHYLSAEANYLERATRLFRTGSRDPWWEGDALTYSETKQAANSVAWGHLFLYEWE
jgi:hypothetical protein